MTDVPSREAVPAVRLEWRPRAMLRVGWTVVTMLVVESLVFGLSVLPAALFWDWFFGQRYPSRPVAIVLLSMAFIPTYLIFAFTFMMLSAWLTGLLGWRTPRDTETRIADLDWPLLDWARYMASVHVVRLFAGAVFRATPLWTLYLRANGARLGKGVYVNSLAVNDHKPARVRRSRRDWETTCTCRGTRSNAGWSRRLRFASGETARSDSAASSGLA
jgi:hypothetical protein